MKPKQLSKNELRHLLHLRDAAVAGLHLLFKLPKPSKTMSISNLEYFVRRVDELAAENARLKSENNRLRKAGDGLMFEGETMAHEVSWNPAPWDRVVAAWVAAKEGGRK